MSVEDLSTWLEAFGIDGFEGRSVMTYDDRIPVAIECSEDGTEFNLNAIVGVLPETADVARHRDLLSSNFYAAKHGGGALAVDPVSGDVIFWVQYPLSALDQRGFEALLGAFLDQADTHKERLFGEQEPVDENADQTAPQGPAVRV